MLIPNHPDPNHPDDERLSALASHDDDATTDAALASHVSICARCTETVTDLRALRASLADLPDVAPSRPLQLLPAVSDAPVAPGGGWIRRLFAPALTAGAALAMVGLIGTVDPFAGMASSAGSAQDTDGAAEAAASQPQRVLSSRGAAAPAAGGETDSYGQGAEASPSGVAGRDESEAPSEEMGSAGGDLGAGTDRQLPAERSPWPMVLFAGVALMVGAALLRWILVPRAG